MNNPKKTAILTGITIIGLSLGLLLSSGGNENRTQSWENVEITDVRNGDTYTVNSLERPVVVESFAVWCPTCTRQQKEIKELHGKINFTSVSLNVDTNEDQEKIRKHIQENSFDWRYSVSPARLTQSLINEFDSSVAQPPSAPVIILCDNKSTKLENGVKTASKLENEIRDRC